MFDLDGLKFIKKIIDLASDLDELDADKDGKPDSKEIVELIFKIKDKAVEMDELVRELGRLVGDDMDAIKAKLGM